ncbi:MAG TPA: glycoside hydrolase family 88 protein [Opitutaceae bacterium]|nr:glycoside hydrolase family 88 protein [Opitutaceae bacterium]
MKTLLRILVLAAIATGALGAEGSYRNRDNPSPNDRDDGTYPIPYQLPTVAEITATLGRIRGYLDTATPTRVVNKKTGAEITDFSTPVADAAAARSAANFSLLAYEMGVVHAGLIQAAEVTGDPAFTAITQRHLQFIADRLPYFRAQEEKFHLERANSFAGLLDPRALDDCGSMCAALIRARLAHLGPDLKPSIDTWSDWIAHKQFRLADGTLARQRPQAQSLWSDDFYMSIPALAEMGRLTGDRAWFDDAVKQVVQMSAREFNPALGIYTHGWNANNPDAPQFYWGRANGWPVLAMCDLLDVLPKDHPGRERVLAQLRAVLRGVAQYQSGQGLWHQLLDRNDTYLETSATAMFVYGYAHAINRGWISPTTYGSIAQAGWCGLTTRINAQGQVEGTCVGTTFASDPIYYYYRPTSVNALHGYGPTLLAGAEMIRLLKNPAIDIQYKLRTYHYVPKDGGQTSYREHQ